MKKTFLISIATIFIASCILQFRCGDNPVNSVDSNDFIAEDDFVFRMDVVGQTSLRMEGISGSITIVGRADCDSVIIAGTMKVGSESYEDAEEHLQYLDVEVEERTGEFIVRTIQPRNSKGRSYVVDYSVILPESFSMLVSNVNGCVTIDSTAGNIVVENVNGQIYLNGITGNANASLVNGIISGTMYLPLDGNITLSNVNGGIVLNIPQTTSSEFEANVTNGMISVFDLDLENEVITNRTVRGTLGDGEGDINISTVNGNIVAQGF